VADLFANLDVLEKAMLAMMEQWPWDLFIGVVTGTDRLNHFLYDAQEDVGHPFHEHFLDYYRRVDRLFGHFMSRIDYGTRVILLSDHGFTELKQQIYVNRILKMMGYLTFTRPDPQSPGDIHQSSKAFAMDPTRIYLNSRVRFSNGVLGPGEARDLRSRLKSELEGLRPSDVGIECCAVPADSVHDRLFAAVKCKEEIYWGDYLHLAPDLVIIPRAGFDPKAALNSTAVVAKDIFTGMHTHDDAFLLVHGGSPITLPNEVSITDVADLIIEGLG
jgi:predicted AlkP superfamily phosphohydrolase/phosphomutase